MAARQGTAWVLHPLAGHVSPPPPPPPPPPPLPSTTITHIPRPCGVPPFLSGLPVASIAGSGPFGPAGPLSARPRCRPRPASHFSFPSPLWVPPLARPPPAPPPSLARPRPRRRGGGPGVSPRPRCPVSGPAVLSEGAARPRRPRLFGPRAAEGPPGSAPPVRVLARAAATRSPRPSAARPRHTVAGDATGPGLVFALSYPDRSPPRRIVAHPPAPGPGHDPGAAPHGGRRASRSADPIGSRRDYPRGRHAAAVTDIANPLDHEVRFTYGAFPLGFELS